VIRRPEQRPNTAHSRHTRWIALVLVAVTAFSGPVGMIPVATTSAAEPSSDPASSPVGSPAPDVTPEPAAEPATEPAAEPDVTPAPTDTPEPSPTPEPAPAPDPTPTAEPEPSPRPTDVPGPTAEPTEPTEPTEPPVPTPGPTEEPLATPGSTDAPGPTAAPEPSAAPSESPSPSASPSATPDAPTVTILVTFRANAGFSGTADALAAAGVPVIDQIPELRMMILAAPPASAQDVIARLAAQPAVANVEQDHERTIEAAPSDPGYTDQWGLRKIGWDAVHEGSLPSGSAVVAVLDTGVDSSHPDLTHIVLPGTSFVAGADAAVDGNGHGTWMAGIVAAETDNALGIAGVGFAGVRILPVTVLAADGTGQDSDIIAGLVYAADAGADVILMAFSNTGYSAALQAAARYAWSKGAILVAATGNAGSSQATFPAGDRSVMGIASTDENDHLAADSNHGAHTFLATPGVGILTTGPADAYLSISGTSAAAAATAGAAALLHAFAPTASNGTIVGRIARSAAPAGTRDETGNGRLDLARALADTGTAEVEPAGVAGPADGGPYVGPYADPSIPPAPTPVGPYTAAAGPVVNFDAASSATSNTAGTTLSWSHTVANQPLRMLVVGVTAEFATNNLCQASAVTFNGVALTKIAERVTTATNFACASLWYLTAPPVGTFTVAVTYQSTITTKTAGSVSLNNVKQAAPDASNGALNDTGAASTSLTTLVANSMVVDVFSSGDTPGNLAAAAGQTSRWIQDAGAAHAGAMSTKAVAGAGSTSMTWTQTGITKSAIVAAAFAPGDITGPAHAIGVTEGTAPGNQHYSAGTYYYNPATTGTFTITDGATDAGTSVAADVFDGVDSTKDQVLADGAASYWRLGETSGTVATDAKGVANGTYAGGVTLAQTGALSGDTDKAASFDGVDDTVTAGDVYDFAGTVAFSVEFWAKKDTNPASVYPLFVNKDSGSSPRNGWNISMSPDSTGVDAGKIGFERWNAGVGDGPTSTTATQVGVWYYIVATYDGTTMRIYINGVLEASAASSLSMPGNAAAFSIGKSPTGNQFDGTIDDVAVYNAALTAVQIDAHYAARTHAAAVTGFSGTAVTDAASPWQSNTHTFTTANTTAPGAETITGTDAVGNTSTGTVTFVRDTTAPSGQTVALSGGPFYNTLSVPLTLGNGSDTQSGVNAASGIVQRASATLTNNVCGGFGSFATVTLSGGADTTVVSGNCYRYVYYVSDNVGIQSAISTASADAKVDTAAPAAPTLTIQEGTYDTYASGTTIWYRPAGAGGTFTVSATTSDGVSGLQKVAFPGLAGGFTPTSITNDTTSPYSNLYTWPATTGTETGAKTVTAYDNANNTASTTFTITPDSTVPTGGSITYTNPYVTTTSLTLTTANGTDTGSSVVGGYAAAAIKPDSPVAHWRLGEPAGSASVADSGTADNIGSINGGVTLGGAAALASDADTSAAFNGSTGFIDVGTNASLALTTALSVEAWVKPAVANLNSGIFEKTTNGATNTSYLLMIEAGFLRFRLTKAAALTTISSNAVLTVGAWSHVAGTWDGTTVRLYVNGVLQTATAALASPIDTGAGVANIGRLPTAGYWMNGSIDEAAIYSSALSATQVQNHYFAGVSGVIERDQIALANGTCGTFPGTFPTRVKSPDTVVSGFCYQYRYKVSDRVANVATYTGATVKVDTSAPTVTASAPTEGTNPGSQFWDGAGTVWFQPSVGGTFTLNANPTDTESGIASVAFPDVSAVTGWTGSTGGTDNATPFSSPVTYTWTSGAVAPGARTLVGTNGAGLTANGTVTISADSTAPAAFALTVPAAAGAALKNGATLTAAPTDTGGSGIGSVEFRYCAGATCIYAGSTLISTDAATPFSVTWSSQPADGTYTLLARAIDNVGNTTDSTTTTVVVDNTATPAGAVGAIQNSGGAYQYFTGSTDTWYYNTAGSGTVTFRDITSDPGSGVSTIAFPTVTGLTGTNITKTGAANGYESGAVGQTASGTTVPTVSSDNTTAHSGIWSTRTVWPAAVTGFAASNTTYTGTVNAVNQQVYVSFWAKASAATSGSIYFYVTGSCGGTGIFPSLTTSFQRFTFITTTFGGACGSQALYSYIAGAALGSPTTVWVDDLEVMPLDSNAYTFNASTTATGVSNIVVTDFAGNARNDGITFVKDTTAPTGSVSAPATSSTGSVPVTITNSDTQSGADGGYEHNAVEATAGLQAYWRLGEPVGTGIVADSTGNNPGNLAPLGYTTQGAAGLLGNDTDAAVSFNNTGTSYISIADSVSLSPTAAISVEAWVKPSATDANYHSVIEKNASYWLRIENNGKLYFYRSSVGVWVGVAGTTTPAAGTTYHVVGTYDGANLKLYVNGVLDATAAATGAIDDSVNALTLSDSTFPFNGTIDEAAVYSSALTAQQVLDHYNAGVTGVLERQLAPLTGNTCGTYGAWVSTRLSGGNDTVPSANCVQYRYRVTDRVGNAATYSSGVTKVDTGGPVAPVQTIVEGTYDTFSTGSTFYYRPAGVGGTFTVTSTTSDPDSGIAQVSFPGLGGGFTPTGATNDASAPFTNTYTWPATTGTESGAKTVTATNNSGGTTNGTFTITQDSTAPSGGSISYTNPYLASTSLTLTTANGTDAGAGISGSYSHVAVKPDGPVSHWRLGEPVGSAQVADSGTAENTGTLVGGVTLGGTSGLPSDLDTSAAFDGSTGSIDVGTGLGLTTAVTVEAWVKPTASNGNYGVFEKTTNGNVNTSYLLYAGGSKWNWRVVKAAVLTTIVSDAAPVAGVWTHVVGTWDGTTLRMYINGVLQANTAAVASPIDTGAGAAYIGRLATGATYPMNGSIDDVAVYGTALSATQVVNHYYAGQSGVIERDSIGLANGTCGTFPGTFPTRVKSPDTVVSGNCYQYRYRLSDRVGNLTTYTGPVVKVDASAPTVSVTAPTAGTNPAAQYWDGVSTYYVRPAAGGSFTLNATSSDAESTVASVAFPDVSATTGWATSTGGSDASSPYTSPVAYTWTATAVSLGARNVTSTNGAGGTNTAAITITADSTGPNAFSLTQPAAAARIKNGQSLDAAPTDAGAGVLSVEFRYCAGVTCVYASSTAIGTDSASPFSLAWSSQPADGVYTVLARATDRVGNTTDSTVVVIVDNTAPPTGAVQIDEVVGPQFQYFNGSTDTMYYNPIGTGTFSFGDSTSDPGSGIGSIVFPGIASTGFNGTARTTGTTFWTSFEAGAHLQVTSGTTLPIAAIDATTAHLGTYSSKTTWPIAAAAASTTFINGTGNGANSGITITFWAKASVATNAIGAYVGGSCANGAVSPIQLATTWTKYILRIGNAGAGCTSERLTLTNSVALAAPLDTWIDDVDVVPDESNTYTFDNTNAAAPANQNVVVTDGAGNARNDVVTFVRDTTVPSGSVSVPTTNSNGLVPVTITNTDSQSGPTSGYEQNVVKATTGLVAYWRLDEAVGSPISSDQSGNGLTATAINGPTFGASGLLGNSSDTAASFDGISNSLEFVESDIADPRTGSFTWEAWFKTSSAATQALFRKGDGNGVNGNEFYISAGKVTCILFGSVIGQTVTVTSPANYNDGTAHQVQCVLDRGTSPTTLRLYMDGAQVITASDTNNYLATTVDLNSSAFRFIGQMNGSWFNGTIDDLALYNVALTAQQVTDHYNGGVSGLLERQLAPLTGNTCGSYGAWTSTRLSGGNDSVPSGNCVQYRYRVTDRVGNAATYSSGVSKVDSSVPTVSITAPSAGTNPGAQYWNGAGIYYFRPAAGGSFTLNATASDADSTIASVLFPDVSASTGWAGSTGGSDASSPYTSPVAYTWTATAVSLGAKNVIATNGSGGTNTAAITITADSAGPTGQTVTLVGGPWYTALSVGLTLANGTDALSGVDATTGIVERAAATLTNGTCGGFGAYATVTLTGGADTTVVSGNCYRYQYKISDNVDNQSTSAASADAKVDITRPAPYLQEVMADSPTDYWRLAESAGATSAKDETGGAAGTVVGGVTFGVASGLADTATAASFDGTTGKITLPSAAVPNTVDAWVKLPVAYSTQRAIYSNRGTGGLIYFGTTGGKAGVFAGGWQIGSISINDGNWHHIAYTWDGTTRRLYVDGQADGTSALSVGTGSFAANIGWDLSNNEWWPGSASDVATYSTALSAARILAHYSRGVDYGLTLTEASPFEFVSPSGNTLYYSTAGSNSGSFAVTSNAADTQSGITNVGFPVVFGSDSLTDATSPYAQTYSWTNTATANAAFTVTITNGAAATSSGVFTLTRDITGPSGQTVALSGGPYYTTLSVPLTLVNGTDTASGVNAASGVVQRASATLTNGTCGSFGAFSTVTLSGGADTTVVAGNCYRYTYSISDNVGNASAASAASADAKVDTTKPSPYLEQVMADGPAAFWRLGETSGTAAKDEKNINGATYTSGYTLNQAPLIADADRATSFAGAGWVTAPDSVSLSPTAAVSVEAWVKPSAIPSPYSTIEYKDGYQLRLESNGTFSLYVKRAGAWAAGTSFTAATIGTTLHVVGTYDGANVRIYINGALSSTTAVTGAIDDLSTNIFIGGTGSENFSGTLDEVAVYPTALSGVQVLAHYNRGLDYGLTIAESSPWEFLAAGGNTLYYNNNGSNTGSFTVTSNAADTQSGIANVAFPVVFGADSLTDPTSPYAQTYSWTNTATANAAFTATITDGAGLTSSGTFTLTRDITAPTGQTVALSGGPWFTTASVPLTLANGSDTGAGLDAASAVVERASAPLTNATCGSFGAFAPVTLVGGADTSVVSGNCYRYTYKISDNVGNQSAASANSADAKVDISAPSAYAESVLADAPVGYWRLGESSGTSAFDARANSTATYAGGTTLGVTGGLNDSDKAISLDGNANYVIRNPFSGFPTTAISAEFWIKTADTTKGGPAISYAVTGSDNEFLVYDYRNFTIYRGLSLVATGVSANDGAWHHIVVTWRSSDGQTQLFKDGSLAFTTTLATGTSITGGGSLVFGQEQDSVGGGFDPTQACLCSLDDVAVYGSVLSSAQILVHRTRGLDGGLTLAESSPFEHISGNTLYYGNSGSNTGTFTLTSSATDGQSGITNVVFPVVFGADSLTDATSPYAQTYSWNNTATANAAFTAVATDGASLTSASTFTVTRDITAPTGQTVALSGGPYYSTLSVPLTLANGSDASSGVDAASAAVQRASATLTGGTCGSFGAYGAVTLTGGADTTVQPGTCYRYQYKISDNVGNQSAASAASADAKVDTTPPSPYAASVLAQTPVGFWRLNEPGGATAFDASGNHRDGAYQAGNTYSVAGATGDGDLAISRATAANAVSVPDNAAFTNANTISLEFWVKIANYSTGYASAPVMKYGSTTDANYRMYLFGTNAGAEPTPGKVALYGTVGGVWNNLTNLSSPLSLNAWHHIVATYDSAVGGHLYVDGVDTGLRALTGTLAANTQPVVMQPQDGETLDDVAIYTSVLSTAQVQTHYTRGLDFGLTLSESSAFESISGQTLYYAPTGTNTGSFSVTSNASETESTVGSVAFPTVFGSDSLVDSASPYTQTYSWTATATATGAKTATITNASGLVSSGTFTLIPDTTAPTGQTVTLVGGPGYSTLSVPLTLVNGTDGASGVNAASGVVQRASATLTNGTCGSFGGYGAVTLSGGADTTVVSGNCYHYTYAISDNVANASAASAASADAKVDTSAPAAPTLTYSAMTNVNFVGNALRYLPGVAGGFTVTALSTDAQSGIASYAFPTLPAGWTVSGSGASRTWTYTVNPSVPSGNQNVMATNGSGLTATTAFTLVVDTRPAAVNDSYSLAEDASISPTAGTGVLANDTDTEVDSLTAVLVTNVTHGTLTLNANGSFTYTPTGNYNGPDSFTYKANDGWFDSASNATVSITVTSVNDAPVGVADSYSVMQNNTLTVAAAGVLANDTDVDLQALTVGAPRPTTGVANGTLTLNPDGSFTYTPNANFSGTDSFTYTAFDGTASSAATTVTITVGDSAYASSSSWLTTFSASRYLKVTIPAYVPTGSVVSGATFTHTYKSETSGDTTCYYFEVYQSTTLIATHGSSGAPVSCNATTSYVTDVVALPEIDTVTEANTLVIKVYIKNSGSRRSLHRLMTVGVSYYLD
jgi:VCBS repeat-containing protein